MDSNAMKWKGVQLGAECFDGLSEKQMRDLWIAAIGYVGSMLRLDGVNDTSRCPIRVVFDEEKQAVFVEMYESTELIMQCLGKVG